MQLHSGIGSGSLAGVHPDSLVPASVTIPRLAVQMRSLSAMAMLRQLVGAPATMLASDKHYGVTSHTVPDWLLPPDWDVP